MIKYLFDWFLYKKLFKPPRYKGTFLDLPEHITSHRISGGNGNRLHGLFYKNKTSMNVVIYFHGNASNLASRMDTFEALWSHGISVFAIDYQGYGLSTGRSSEYSLSEDAIKSYEYVVEVLHFRPKNIIVLGMSLGSFPAITLGASVAVEKLILVSPISSLIDYCIYHKMWFAIPFLIKRFRNDIFIKKVTAPTLIIHSVDDGKIPYTMGQTLFQNLRTKRELKLLYGPNHTNDAYCNHKDYWGSVMDFIR